MFGRSKPGVLSMQSENPLLADLAKLLNSAAGTMAGMGREARDGARERARELLGGLDFVSRDEFEAVKAIAVKARDEADALRARLDALSAKLELQTAAHGPGATDSFG
jgi:BMFP domain-containing protein YqiC